MEHQYNYMFYGTYWLYLGCLVRLAFVVHFEREGMSVKSKMKSRKLPWIDVVCET